MPLSTSSTSPMRLYSLSQSASAMLNPPWLDDLSTRSYVSLAQNASTIVTIDGSTRIVIALPEPSRLRD